MRTRLKTLAGAALLGFLLVLPFLIMEIVNRQRYGEGFPGALFFVMWLNLFALSLILLPVGQGWRARSAGAPGPVPAPENTLLAKPGPAARISLAVFAGFGFLVLLDALGVAPVQALLNGPDPEQEYIPGLLIEIVLYLALVAAAVIAAGPTASTLRAGGSLFAHPLNLIIVVLFVSVLAFGVGSLIIDQWPCFIGVPTCD